MQHDMYLGIAEWESILAGVIKLGVASKVVQIHSTQDRWQCPGSIIKELNNLLIVCFQLFGLYICAFEMVGIDGKHTSCNFHCPQSA